jgi:hypothetical protein
MKSRDLRDLRALVPVARATPNGNCVEFYGKTRVIRTTRKEYPVVHPSEIGTIMLQLFKKAYDQRISDKKRYVNRILLHLYEEYLTIRDLNGSMMRLNAILSEHGICITKMADEIRSYLGYKASFWRNGQVIVLEDIVQAWKMVKRKENFLKIENFLWLS